MIHVDVLFESTSCSGIKVVFECARTQTYPVLMDFGHAPVCVGHDVRIEGGIKITYTSLRRRNLNGARIIREFECMFMSYLQSAGPLLRRKVSQAARIALFICPENRLVDVICV